MRLGFRAFRVEGLLFCVPYGRTYTTEGRTGALKKKRRVWYIHLMIKSLHYP